MTFIKRLRLVWTATARRDMVVVERRVYEDFKHKATQYENLKAEWDKLDKVNKEISAVIREEKHLAKYPQY